MHYKIISIKDSNILFFLNNDIICGVKTIKQELQMDKQLY